MELIVIPSKGDLQNLDKLGMKYLTFDEKFAAYSKQFKKSKKVVTKEIFSLNYDSLLSDLEKSVFVECHSDEEIITIEKHFNVIEHDD